MKTLGRILIILIAFAIAMSITYSTVSAKGSTSASGLSFQRSGEDFSSGGVRPENQDGGSSAGGIMFGLMKNIIIVAFVVAMVAFPKNLMQQRPRAVPVRIN